MVGAGPAGAVASRELARRGRTVLLIDRATFPRPKVCGCCLNSAALGTLAAVGLGGLVEQCGAVPLGRVRLAAGGRSAELGLPGGMALSRDVFDAALVREAIAAGASFLSGTNVVRSLRERSSPNRSRSERTKFQAVRGSDTAVVSAGVLIAADGLNGQLTASEGSHPTVAPGSRIGAGAVADTAPDFYNPGAIFMAVDRGGYVGLVRLEDGRLDIAAAFDPAFARDAGKLGSAAGAIVSEAGLPTFPGLNDLRWRGTPALTRTPRRVAGERWFAVGDAAGYVEPFTGEGMAWAVASAVAVVPLAAPPWHPGLAREWEETHARLIRSRQATCRAAARVLRSPRLSRWAVRLLSVAPVLARPVVAALNRPAHAPGPVA
ncbi:MAG TPA: FAD-dependent monooxygenase [Fimbriiglobus sp.]|nr:FAD-dependent monooxygenase [Fimbriiglobus sp.]